MQSTLEEFSFSLSQILSYGTQTHARATITSLSPERDTETMSFTSFGARVAACAHALHEECGVTGNARVATMMHNNTEHLEILFSSICMGAVFHPLNPFFTDDQLIHIINHASDTVLACSADYSSRILTLLDSCPSVRTLIVIGAEPQHIAELSSHSSSRVVVYDYETLLDGHPTRFDWPRLPEKAAAALCYSTGTEGAPKGVVYSHRALWVAAMDLRSADGFGIHNGQDIFCAVPIYHILAWGIPIAAFVSGANLIFTTNTHDSKHIAEVIDTHRPGMAAGEPKIWLDLLLHYRNHPRNTDSPLSLVEILSGGSHISDALIDSWREEQGVRLIQCWGMTETLALGSVARPPAGVTAELYQRYQYMQGRISPMLSVRIVDENGNTLPANDRSTGEVQVQGNTVTSHYYHSSASDGGRASEFRGKPVDDAPDSFTTDGWLKTGDIGTLTSDGYLIIHDRKSDTIIAGGERIFSASLENILLSSPPVHDAAVIGITDSTWGQRPLALISLRAEFLAERNITSQDLTEVSLQKALASELAHTLASSVPGWMVPENWCFLKNLPRTSVRKVDKNLLRSQAAANQLNIINIHDQAL